jgi:hypothetical protein
MDNYLMKVVDYFKPPGNYFWRWADGGQAIEWREGDTICYRDELLAMLKQLSREGLPSLGAILLVMSACRERADTPAAQGGIPMSMLRLLDYQEKNSAELSGLKDKMVNAIRFLQQVAALPPELRTGNNRTWLLYVAFEKAENKITIEDANRVVDIFNSGRLDYDIFRELPAEHTAKYDGGFSEWNILSQAAKTFGDDMEALQFALQAFPTAQELELAVRSGVQQLPKAAELEMPRQETGDVLEQLEQDPNTTGLAQLTQRLIAALNIPMHAHGSSGQLFGGVSDITNRGNFDRLLLSELAHDDLSLMARLANNEALYLRREELPSNPEKQRLLLIDTTLKMWGLPRVFAVSAALACAHNNKAKARITSYTLSGTGYNVSDLATKEGVVHSLAQLDAALHCGRALSLFMTRQTVREEDEVFLITEEETTHSVLFQSILSSLKRPVNFLVTVNRSGELRFYEYLNGRRKQLNEARFDLQELLFHVPKKVTSTNNNKALVNAPAIMQHSPAPLYFPASKIKFNTESFYEMKKDHLFCITIDQRVLYWNSRLKGAREVVDYLEPGQVCFGSDGDTTLYMLVYSGSTNFVKLYEVNPELNFVEITKLPQAVSGTVEMAFDSGYFYIRASNNLCSVEAATGKVYPGQDRLGVFNVMVERYKKAISNLNHYKKYINDGYTTLNTVRSFYVNFDGELGFDDRHISFRANNEMIIIDHNRQEQNKNIRVHRAKQMAAPAMSIPNANLRFSRFVWADGSEVLVDSRGLLHLKSSDKSIPEITIVMIMGRQTACWAADGRVCGSPYFTGVTTAESHDVTGFYYNYIQRFIDRLEKYATNAEV